MMLFTGSAVEARGLALKRFFAFAFYRIISQITGVNIPRDTGDFRLIDRRALNALLALREKHRFVRGMVSWIGYQYMICTNDQSGSPGKQNIHFGNHCASLLMP